MNLFGCYTGTSQWNPNGNDANVNTAWEQAVRAFGKNVGRDVNCVNVFPCWDSMKYWAINSSDLIAKGVAKSGFGTNFVPIVGLKMISNGAQFDGYAWNDVKGYNDVASGKWDATWRGVVQAFASAGFKYVIIRAGGYEYNGSFMEDFMGWDATSQAAWKNGFSRVASVLKDEAGKAGIRVDVMLNPNVMSSCPDVAGNIPDPKNWDIFGLDIYNGFWGEGDVNNADVRRAFWDNPKGGWGMQAHIAFAKKLGKPVFFAECGSGPSANGVAHGIANDPAFWPWLAGAVTSMRQQGVPFWGLCAWDINPSDGGWRFSDGTQQQCLSDFKANVQTFVGDDVMGGGGRATAAPAPAPAPVAVQAADPAASGASTTAAAIPVPMSISSFTPALVGEFHPDVLVLRMSEDAYQGDAQFIISVDGQPIGGTQTVKAPHGSGQSQNFVVKGHFPSGQHTVNVQFLNDAWGGTPATDRNLYVNDATVNGVAIPGSTLVLEANGSKSFTFQMAR